MRKSLILSLACLMGISAMAQVQLKDDALEEIDAIKVTQGSTTDWYLFDNSNRLDVPITNGNPVFNGKTYDLANGNVETEFGMAPEDTWYTVRTDVTPNDWNTICLEHNITAIDGATFWNVVGQDATSFILDEVTAPEAGQGYLIRFTAKELKVQYGTETATEPVLATYGSPIQGTFELIDFDKETGENILVGNYVVYNNQLCPVEAWVGLLAHRAYVVTEYVPNNAPAPAPGRARAYMPKPKQTPTELESVHDGASEHSDKCTMHDGKFLRNGQLIIVKDNKIYNAQGMKL